MQNAKTGLWDQIAEITKIRPDQLSYKLISKGREFICSRRMLRPISSSDNFCHPKKPDVLHPPSPSSPTGHHISLGDLSSSTCKTSHNTVTPTSHYNDHPHQSWVPANQSLNPLRPSPPINAKQTTTESLINQGIQRPSCNLTGHHSEMGSAPYASSSFYVCCYSSAGARTNEPIVSNIGLNYMNLDPELMPGSCLLYTSPSPRD